MFQLIGVLIFKTLTSLYFFIRFDLELIDIQKPMREALEHLKSTHPEIKAIVMGTRSTDPHGGKYTHGKYYNLLCK